MDIAEVSPIILSIFLLTMLHVRRRYWFEKIEKHLSRYDLSKDKLNNIVEIVEDVYTSISFVGAIIAILFGIVLVIFKESVVNKSLPFLSVDFCILVCLALVYMAALYKIFSMKTKLLTRELSTPFLSKLSYCQIFNALLIIGYVGTLYVMIDQ